MKTLPIGTIIHGTMRIEDLVPALIDALRSVSPTTADTMQAEFDTCKSDEDRDYFLYETLFDAMDEYCLPFTYFGSHPGDGCDYGVWPVDIDDACQFSECIKIEAGDELPPVGELVAVFAITDHGNVTCYVPDDNDQWKEVWSIV